MQKLLTIWQMVAGKDIDLKTLVPVVPQILALLMSAEWEVLSVKIIKILTDAGFEDGSG